MQCDEAELVCSACGADEDGRLSFRHACLVCMVWLLRRRQQVGVADKDAFVPIFQSIDKASLTFTGKMVDPLVIQNHLQAVLQQAVVARAEQGLLPLPGLATPADVRAWTLYSARHGGIMQRLIDATTSVQDTCVAARLPMSTMMLHYRRHDILDDVFENNGKFGETSMHVLLAEARREGVQTTSAQMSGLLDLLTPPLTIEAAIALERRELYKLLSPLVAGNAICWI